MTLRELLASDVSGLFYRQTWYDDEPFLDVSPESVPTPDVVLRYNGTEPLPTAADLALAYTKDPTSPIWRRFLWTRDRDRYDQRIYVGGVGAFGSESFQIHRHLNITELWGVPTWKR